MFKTIKYEFEKNYTTKTLYVGIILSVIITLAFILIGNNESCFTIPLNTLTNMNSLYIYIILLSLSGYVFGIEQESKTLKILRCKTVKPFEIIISKFLVSVSYAMMIFAATLIVSTLIGSLLQPMKDIQLIGVNDENIVINASQGYIFVFKAYAIQFIASIFVISLSIFLTIILDSYVISSIGTFLIVIVLNLLKSVHFLGLGFLQDIIPYNCNNMFPYLFYNEQLQYKIIQLLVYTLILLILSIIAYRKKEIKK